MRRCHIPAPVLAALVAAGCGSSVKAVGDAVTDPGHDALDAADTATEPPADAPHDARPDDPSTGCGMGVSCPDGFFCELPVGVCDPDLATGTCVEIPHGGCPEYYSPECGCNGVTYDNPCYRLQAGQHLMSLGTCPPGDPCAPWLDECDEGYICETPPDSCWLEGVMGRCMPIRDDCGFLWDPQCGCDGETYSNECERMAALVMLDHWGECGDGCGMPGDPPCPDGTFCEFPTGFCSATGIPGECMIIPLECPDIYAPVCGCDGHTYGNDCERRAHSAQLHHPGEC